MDSIVDTVLAGTHTEEQLTEFAAKLPEEGKKLFDQARAFVKKRQDEEQKLGQSVEQRQENERLATEALEKLKKAEEDLALINGQKTQVEQDQSQFRTEQVSKAKEAFFAEFAIPAEQQAQYEEEFKKHDSGKVDPELIKKDWVRAYAAINADALVASKKTADDLKKNADLDKQGSAGSHEGSPEGERQSEFSDTAKELSQKAGIPVETAERINKEGMTRNLG